MGNKRQVFKTGDGQMVGFRTGAHAVFSTTAIKSGGDPADAAKEKPLLDNQQNQLKWIPWGDDDDFPNQILEKLGKLGVGRAALEGNADMHYGLGVEWWYDQIDEQTGKRTSKLTRIDDWVRLKRDEDGELAQSELVDSLEYFYIGFVQFMLSKDRTRVNWTKTLNTPFCRFQRQDASGNIPGIIYSSDFPDQPKGDNFQTFPLFDKRDPYKNGTFVVPVYYSTWGKLFYPEPDYFAVFRNKWVDIAIGVPALINAMYENFATLKYHISIPKEYFYSKYKDWDEKTAEEQITIFEDEQDAMNKFLTGKENVGKAFFSIFGLDENGKEIPGWKIEPIKNYLEATAELPNNDAANYEILFAMNHDPSLGLGAPGKGNETGSGSDKRVSRNNKLANSKRARIVSLQVPKLIARLNGYYQTPEIGPYLYPDYVSADTSQTLDQNPTGSQTVKS